MTDLERIARILCEADGCDPDVQVYETPLPVDRRGRLMASLYPPVATWMQYVFLVRTTLEAVMTGAENTDLHAMLQDILDGGDVPDADYAVGDEEPQPDPSQRRKNWRVHYGLEQQP